MTVNVGRVKLLIHALLSEEFAQGTGSLEKVESKAIVNDDYSYRYEKKVRNCCLGVGCRVAELAGLEIETQLLNDDVVRFNGDTGYLPIKVQEWFGFDRGNPMLIRADGIETNAVDMNDTQKATFKDIAEAFRRTYVDPVPVKELKKIEPPLCDCPSCVERREEDEKSTKAAKVANDLAALTATVAVDTNVETPTTEVEATNADTTPDIGPAMGGMI